MKINDIKDLLKFITKLEIEEINIETKNINIKIKKNKKDHIISKQINNKDHIISKQINNKDHIISKQINNKDHIISKEIKNKDHVISEEINNKDHVISEKIKLQNVKNKSNYIEIKSPLIGMFYIKLNPKEKDFIKEGDIVQKGKTICIIESMKIFNEIKSEFNFKVIKILINNNSFVGYNSKLFLISKLV